MSDAKPYSKLSQLARGPKRYRRKIASPKQWQAIIAEKGETCRLAAGGAEVLHRLHRGEPVQYHHLIPRDMGGEDVADNIVPLCQTDHDLVTQGHKLAIYRLGEALTDAERAYVLDKGTDAWVERAFGGAVTR